jgi:NADPH2:quinone reductase
VKTVVVEDHGSPDVLSVTEQSVSPPEPTEVRVEVAYAGLNFADVEKRRGAYPTREAIHSPTPPYVPGLEAAGRVAEAGTDTEFESGDRVFTLAAPGCYRESVTVAADCVSRAPDGVDLQTASGMIVSFSPHTTPCSSGVS